MQPRAGDVCAVGHERRLLTSPFTSPCDEVKGFCLVLRRNHYTIELSLISVVKLRVEEILKIATELTVDGVE